MHRETPAVIQSSLRGEREKTHLVLNPRRDDRYIPIIFGHDNEVPAVIDEAKYSGGKDWRTGTLSGLAVHTDGYLYKPNATASGTLTLVKYTGYTTGFEIINFGSSHPDNCTVGFRVSDSSTFTGSIIGAFGNGDNVSEIGRGEWLEITITLSGAGTTVKMYSLSVKYDSLNFMPVLHSLSDFGATLTGGIGIAKASLTAQLMNGDYELSDLLANYDPRNDMLGISTAPANGDSADYAQLFRGRVVSFGSGDLASITSSETEYLSTKYPRLKTSDFGTTDDQYIAAPFGDFDDYVELSVTGPVLAKPEKVTLSIKIAPNDSALDEYAVNDTFTFTYSGTSFAITNSAGESVGGVGPESSTAVAASGQTQFTIYLKTEEPDTKQYLQDGDYFTVKQINHGQCYARQIDGEGLRFALSTFPVNAITNIWVNGTRQYSGNYSEVKSGIVAGHQIAYVDFTFANTNTTTYSGTGLNDGHFKGFYKLSVSRTIVIAIDSLSPDHATYSVNGASALPLGNVSTSPTSIPGTAFDIMWDATTGHAVGDTWTLTIADVTDSITNVTWSGKGIEWNGAVAENPGKIWKALVNRSAFFPWDEAAIYESSTIARCIPYWQKKGILFKGSLAPREYTYLSLADELFRCVGDVEVTEGLIRVLPIRDDGIDSRDTGQMGQTIHYRDAAIIPQEIPKKDIDIQNVIKLNYGNNFFAGSPTGFVIRQNDQSVAEHGPRNGHLMARETPTTVSYCKNHRVALAVCDNWLAFKSEPPTRVIVEPFENNWMRLQLGDPVRLTAPGVPNPKDRRNGIYDQPAKVVGFRKNATTYTMQYVCEIWEFLSTPGEIPVPDEIEFVIADDGPGADSSRVAAP